MITLDSNGYVAHVEEAEPSGRQVEFDGGNDRSAVRDFLLDSHGKYVQWNPYRIVLHEVQSYGTECEFVSPRPCGSIGIEREFFELVTAWKEESEFMSSASDMAMLPSYQRIIGMGKDAVPLLLQELAQRPDHYFWALKAITAVDPVAASDRGCVPRMTKAWLEWGANEGYL